MDAFYSLSGEYADFIKDIPLKDWLYTSPDNIDELIAVSIDYNSSVISKIVLPLNKTGPTSWMVNINSNFDLMGNLRITDFERLKSVTLLKNGLEIKTIYPNMDIFKFYDTPILAENLSIRCEYEDHSFWPLDQRNPFIQNYIEIDVFILSTEYLSRLSFFLEKSRNLD